MTRIPAWAEVAVEIEITNGIASPRACGQAITSTVTVRITPSDGSPSSVQTTIVDDRGAGGEVEQRGGGPIGERLGPGLRRLGVGHQTLDAGQRGVVADGVDTDPDRRVGRHRAGDDPIAVARGGPGATRR